jgi:peptide chain release factor 2
VGVAADLGRRLAELKEARDRFLRLAREAEELYQLWELAVEEGEEALEPDIARSLAALEKKIDQAEVEALLGEPYDNHAVYLTIHAGAGGTEAQDWAAMLLRMYQRWGEEKGYEVELLDSLAGEEAGIKSATLRIAGPYAYGYLKSENGVHRLVRISPFDAARRRHTSFASVEVLPELEQDEEVVIDPEDLRIDTFRASGHGGQHVNKTESAVRITHLPTGIVVQCQNERSQHANRLTAMKILQAKLFELKRRQEEERLNALKGEQKEIAWGSQIRSYVLQPYQMVKDHRTGLELGNVEAVLDGDIDALVLAYLRQRARQAHAVRARAAN